VDLPALLALARRSSRDEFVKHFRHPFLARPRLAETAHGVADDAASTDVGPLDHTPPIGDQLRPAAVRYVPIVRNPTSPYTDRITIGRTANCDVVLKDRSVSKLHALLWPHADQTRWAVCDARSANGTFLNSTRLAPLQKVPIRAGDLLRLGLIEMRFVDASLLYDLLLRRLPRLPPR